MAYTPVGWQTGDTITADRLNRMDRGWGYESTELFSETVTTAVDPDYPDDPAGVQLAYSDIINADNLIVTFDGIKYECPLKVNNRVNFYGGFNNGPDFTEYPFFISSAGFNASFLMTQTAGEHTVSAAVPSLQTSADFAEAASAVIGGAFYPFVDGTTTWQQVVDAMVAGKLVLLSRTYTYDGSMPPDSKRAGLMLVTEAYTDSNGDFHVSAVTTDFGSQSVKDYSAGTADGVLS